MVKRKITSYYKSSKKRSTAAGRRSGKVTRKPVARRRNKVRRGSRNTRRRSKKSSNIKVTKGNLRTLYQQVIDRVQVPSASGTAGTADFTGKRCTYYFPGVNQSKAYTLSCMTHIINMARTIQLDEQAMLGTTGSITPQPINETKYLVKDSHQIYDIVNCSNASAVLTFYKCMFQKEVLNGEGQTDLKLMLGDGFYQRNGLGTRGLSNASLYDPDLSPFESHKFCSYVKILDVSTQILNPGQMTTRRIHTGSYYVNMSHYTTTTSATQTFTEATLDYAHHKGEMCYLIKVEGQPANDAGAANLTYTAPAIDVDSRCTYTYQSVNRQAPAIYQMPAVGYSTPATVQIMEDETGAVANSINA